MYNFNMISIRSLFTELAAATTGFHGAVAGAKTVVTASTLLMGSAGFGGAPVVLGLAALAVGAAVGGAIGYMGTKQLISSIDGMIDGASARDPIASPRERERPLRVGRAPRRAGPPRTPALQPPAPGSRRGFAKPPGQAPGGTSSAQGEATGPIVRGIAKAWREAPRMNDPAELEHLPVLRRALAKSWVWPHVKF